VRDDELSEDPRRRNLRVAERIDSSTSFWRSGIPLRKLGSIAENIYRYESDTGFSAEIMVDDLGLVTAYPRGWERIAAF
jgi:hypothetical protein